MRSPLRWGALLALALLAVGCAGGEQLVPPDDAVGTPVPSESPTPTPTPVDDPLTSAWTGDPAPIVLDNGWVVDDCLGDAPMLCVTHDDRQIGVVEHLVYPLDPEQEDDGSVASLRDRIGDFYTSIAADREIGCGADYRVEGLEPVTFMIDGSPGIRYRLSGFDASGTERERSVGYMTVRADGVNLIAATAYDPAGCIGTEGGEFTPADLDRFEPYLDRIVAGTPLPSPAPNRDTAALGDGTHTVWLRGLDNRARTITVDPVDLLSGPEAVAAARADGSIGPGEDLPNDVYIRDTDPDRFTLRLRSDADVTVVDCTGACETRPIPLAMLLSGEVGFLNGAGATLTIDVVRGEVTRIAEVYLP